MATADDSLIGRIDTLSAHGRSYRIHNPGGRIGTPIARGRPYESRLLELIYSEGHQCTAIDVGAHVGNHSLWLAVVCGLTVKAFEPLHTADLHANVALNDLSDDRVEVHGCALGAEAGWAMSLGRGQLQVGAGEIPVATLDRYEFTDVALIKADVEFMEPDVLIGAEQTIRDQHPTLYLEVHDRDRHNTIAAVLEPWGYRHTLTAKTASPVERWEHHRSST